MSFLSGTKYIGIPVVALGVVRGLHKRVGAEESACLWVEYAAVSRIMGGTGYTNEIKIWHMFPVNFT